MRRRIRNLISLLLCAVFVFTAAFSSHAAVAVTPPKAGELRGVWVSTVFNIDYPSSGGLSQAKLKSEALSKIEMAKELGFNAIFLQVRPESDAFYKSSIFPWSRFLTGAQGKAPEGDFDPLSFWVDECHKRGMELHAWINPLRVTASANTPLTKLAETNPARVNADKGWAVSYSSKLYYDPGKPEVRQMIVDGAAEIARNYKVDGIHLDDYFYPGASFGDSSSYAQYGGGLSIEDWRRSNIDTLIRTLGEKIHEVNPNIDFGVSPPGIWANKASNPLGSGTTGYESYSRAYADSRKWVKESYVDYIAPQIYWYIGQKGSDFATLLAWWEDVVRGTDVKLYVGHGLYKVAEAKSSSDPWYGTNEIKRQVSLARQSGEYDGSIYFTFNSMLKSGYAKSAVGSVNRMLTLTSPTKSSYGTTSSTVTFKGSSDPKKDLLINGIRVTERDVNGDFTAKKGLVLGKNSFKLTQGDLTTDVSVTRYKKLVVKSPTKNISTYDSIYTVTGTSESSRKVTINGIPIGLRSPNGDFKVNVPLEFGYNKVSVSQLGKTYTYTVKRLESTVYKNPYKLASAAGSPLSTLVTKIPKATVYPEYDVFKKSKVKLTLSTFAPQGCTVTAIVGDARIPLVEAKSSTAPKAGEVFLVKHSASYALPEMAIAGASHSFGKVKYEISKGAETASVESTGRVSEISATAKVIAEVKKVAQTFDLIKISSGWFYSKNGTYGTGISDTVTSTDGITGTSDELLKLSSGLWVKRTEVTLRAESDFKPDISSIGYVKGNEYDSVELDMVKRSAVSFKNYLGLKNLAVDYSGGYLSFTVQNASGAPQLSLPDNSPFQTAAASYVDGKATYKLSLKSGMRVDGYYIDSTDKGVAVRVKNHRVVTSPEKPLKGRVILLDPGHGGKDPGALSYSRTAPHEEDINLSIALKVKKSLEAMGASVYLTRSADEYVSLTQRLSHTMTAMPDLYMSIHANSASSSATGFEILYREGVSKSAAEKVYSKVISELGRNGRGVVLRNELFVIQPTFVPTILVETGFLSNATEYKWLASTSGQTQMANSLARGVEAFFAR